MSDWHVNAALWTVTAVREALPGIIVVEGLPDAAGAHTGLFAVVGPPSLREHQGNLCGPGPAGMDTSATVVAAGTGPTDLQEMYAAADSVCEALALAGATAINTTPTAWAAPDLLQPPPAVLVNASVALT